MTFASDVVPDGATTVIEWVRLVHSETRSYRRLWATLDDRLRLALAQCWTLHTCGKPDDDLAEDLAADDSDSPHFATMSEEMVSRWRNSYRVLRAEIGVLCQVNIVGVDMELVVLTGPEYIGTARENPILAHCFIVRFEDDEWKIAALARRLPVPGWPPKEHAVPGLGIDI